VPQPATHYRFLDNVREQLDYAFQPIVNIYTGSVYGYEALLRGQSRMGFREIRQVFDFAHQRGFLYSLETTLREMAIEKFAHLPHARHVRLFFNLDPRTVSQETRLTGRTSAVLARHGLKASNMCFELTEVHDFTANPQARECIQRIRGHRHQLAIDDFGTGFSGLKLLYELPPDHIKIDRFFISGISTEPKKKLFVTNTVALAHVLGIQVIAEGVETEDELMTCKEIGCDLVQGFFVEAPRTRLSDLRPRYPEVERVAQVDRRGDDSDSDIIRNRIEFLPPLRENDDMGAVFEAFRRHKERSFFPVVDDSGRPLGIIRETELKDFIYSDYGRDLISNKAYRKTIGDFLNPCPVADVNSSAARVLGIYTANHSTPGVLMVEDFIYVGFLSASSLLRVLDEKNLAVARDQNPLTRLPGNNAVVEYVSHVLADGGAPFTLVYFDFDHFKPFNDTYGFRQGDRAITLFAEMLRKELGGGETFLGHIGGDDFFAGFRDAEPGALVERVRDLREKFARNVESFYDAEAREQGFIRARDREGELRRFPLLTVSAAIVHLPRAAGCCTLDELTGYIAAAKKRAKADRQGYIVEDLAGLPLEGLEDGPAHSAVGAG
jgi:diguanylate cyclase (GGDEF)-like protein